ncbi:uracil-DNA glycosylase [Litorilinea aerophila]|nr:uracil-DNA glycosylase [Litorilinea aerophila]MCC9077888.1 uracil-DNA glycosylase [Litorilinea aerophila]
MDESASQEEPLDTPADGRDTDDRERDGRDDEQDVIEQMHALEAEVRRCQRCRLARTRTHAVPGEGDYRAVVMFVGEGPGYEEDRQGRPFVGRSGQFLTETLARLGIRREEVYITNVVKCRPPENRDPQPDELEACADYLERQVALINPRIIVTLGRFSMRRWFPNGTITKIHGQVRNIGRGRVAMAMFHPAAALRNPRWREAFEKDMQKLPPLIERARKANAAARRGEALPAGVPHPGDPDYEPAGQAGHPAEMPTENDESASATSAQ